MQTSDVANIIKKFPALSKRFVGVFPIDKLPSYLDQKSCLIFNMDPSHKAGSHWVALLRAFDNNYEVFNSLGTNFPEIEPYLKFADASYEYNLNAFQMPTTSSCGLYTIFFLVHRMYNIDMTFRLLLSDVFATNKKQNEKIVLNFFKDFV